MQVSRFSICYSGIRIAMAMGNHGVVSPWAVVIGEGVHHGEVMLVDAYFFKCFTFCCGNGIFM
jgi:hypothetical protein